MFILLIESDPFVRIDLCEALQDSFPNAMVKCAENLDGLSSLAAQARLIILDTPCSEILANRFARYWIDNDARVILTNESSMESCAVPKSWGRLQRPFNEKMLLDALNASA